jgi:hypothetical protein
LKAAVKILIFIILFASVSFGQVTSTITYDPASDLNIGAGADVCANQVIINGTFGGSGTICGGALPVSLSTFVHSVDKRIVTLTWVTEWEINNSGFDIERANVTQSGIEGWNKIAFVQGKGTSNISNGYFFKDEKLKAGTYRYRLKQIDYNGNFEYFQLNSDVQIIPPKNFEMSQNYPNPSNPKCRINFEIPVNGKVNIKVYDLLGREVITLLDETREADYYTIEFDGSNLASGVYFYRITAEDQGEKFTKTMKMVLVK